MIALFASFMPLCYIAIFAFNLVINSLEMSALKQS